MDPNAAIIEKITMAMTTLQDKVFSLSQRIDRQQTPQIPTQQIPKHLDTQLDIGAPPLPPLLIQMAPSPVP